MKVAQLPAIANEGRFGNKLIHYVVGKCYAESVGATVEIPREWLGEKVFEIHEPYIQAVAPLLSPMLNWNFDGTVALPPFFNLPHRIVDPCLTRETVKRLLKWRAGWLRIKAKTEAAMHVRRGDFLIEQQFPVVTERHLLAAAGRQDCLVVKEDKPMHGLFPKHLEFLADFQTLMLAKNVFVYPRSTFSQMAALLGDGNIYMPYDYGRGPTTCKFRLADPSQPVIFPTKNNNLP
jgi:hypothetical protein